MSLTEHDRTQVQLCGDFAVEIEGRRVDRAIRGRQARVLFAYLVLHRQRPVRRDELIEALWSDELPVSPDNALSTHVSRLRKVLGNGIVAGRSELRLELPGDVFVDVESAFEAVQRAEAALEGAVWKDATDAAELALSITDRGFLPDVDLGWAERERRQLDEVRLRALECVAACGLEGSRLSATERAARRLIDAAPYRETGYRYLMQALAERGRVAEAVRVFDDARRLLQAELGTSPTAGLRSLHERLLREQGVESQCERDDPLAVGAGTTTSIFSDVVCTADVAPEHGDDLRRAHRRLVRQAIAAHRGSVLETDAGAGAVFHRARSGIDCAIELQQAVERHNHRHPKRQLSVRVALHSAPRISAAEEFTSTSLISAEQICARAVAGQILASALVCSGAGPQQRCRDVGSLTLADSSQPLTVLEVAWEPAAQPPISLPTTFVTRADERFVGREHELERLWALYERARSGVLQVAFARGEPGIGKTRLASELALRAHADGAVVLYGRCDEEPLQPHQPFAQALQHYVASCPLGELAGQVSSSGPELRRLVPELAERLPNLGQPMADDRDGARHRLFASVSSLLCNVADARPLVLVLDDLHWADKPTLLLLRHLARHPRPASLFLLSTYRDADVSAGHPLRQTLADLNREPGFARVSLGALDMAGVEALVRLHAEKQPPEFISRLFAETEGNPFFIVEILRSLADADGAQGERWQRSADIRLEGTAIPDRVPERVKEVIGRRIERLAERTRRVLAIASVCGRDFDFAVLAHLCDVCEDELVDTLEEAARARVIDEVPGALGRYTFTHALIRETIYRNLSGTRRALLHRRVGASLEELYAAELDAHRAELAHHFAQAGTAGDVEKAIEYAARAGDSAVAQLAYEQAAAHYRSAVSLIDTIDLPGRQGKRCDLAIAQGEAERQAGDPAYRATLLAAARLADELGDRERLTRAALANNRGFFSAAAGVDRERVAVLEAALRAHGDHDSAVRASLLAHLATELFPDSDWRRRAALSDEALAMARRIGDPRTLARTLNHRYIALWGPRTLPERLANTQEATGLIERHEDPLVSFQSARFGAHAAMEAGDLPLADGLLERARALGTQLGQPIIDWYYALTRAKRESISGSPAEAEKLACDAFEVGHRVSQPDARLWLVIQLFVTRLLQGTLNGDHDEPLEPGRVGAPDSAGKAAPNRSVPLLVEAVQIATACELGRSDEVHARFDLLMRNELRDLPYDWTALAIPAVASVACAHFGDLPRARTLYAMLQPYAGQFVDSGPAWFGTTSHHLANLALMLGRPRDADAHFADATDAYTRLGANAWLIRAQLDRARAASLPARHDRRLTRS